MSFTPGPWHSDLTISSQAGRVSIEPDIAIVYVQPSRYDESVSKQRLDNARLIAAAPELYDAVIDCLGWMACHCGHPACKQCRATKIAEAAIAKAKGAGE